MIQDEKIIKKRYVGESFFFLTDGQIYEMKDYDFDYYAVMDNAQDGWYLYGKVNPAPLDGSSKGGYWEDLK